MTYFYPACRVVIGVVLDGYERAPEPLLTVSSVPASATIYRNSYKQADSWSVEFDAADLPVHPAQIRTGQIELHLYQTEGLQPYRPGDLVGRRPTITGLFDQASLRFNDSDRTISIDGQDFTALLLAKRWDFGRRVDAGRPLSRILEEFLREVSPPIGGASKGALTLDYRAKSDPTVGAYAPKYKKKKKYTPKDAKSIWDVIFDLTTRNGLIAFIEGYQLVVTTPRARFDEAESRLRKLAWGRNIEELEIERNMGKDRTPQIKVRCWDPDNQKTIEGVFPTKARRATVGVGTDFEEVQVYLVTGITSQDALAAYAQAIYDLRARGEHRIVARTSDLRDLDSKDLLDLRAGDPLMVTFDPFNTDELNALGTTASRTQYLIGRGFQPQVAATFANNLAALVSFRKPLRVRETSYDWSVDDGIEVEVELQEFITPDEATV
jgi:hypothetical protein